MIEISISLTNCYSRTIITLEKYFLLRIASQLYLPRFYRGKSDRKIESNKILFRTVRTSKCAALVKESHTVLYANTSAHVLAGGVPVTVPAAEWSRNAVSCSNLTRRNTNTVTSRRRNSPTCLLRLRISTSGTFASRGRQAARRKSG